MRTIYVSWRSTAVRVRSVECESKYALRSSGGAIRRALFRVERGVCVKCRADCRGLVERLRAIERGSRDWEARRRARIREYAPRCAMESRGPLEKRTHLGMC